MKLLSLLLSGLLGTALCATALAAQQNEAQRFARQAQAYAKEKPTIGDRFPQLTVYDPQGREVPTSSLLGHYTVLTFGCLT